MVVSWTLYALRRGTFRCQIEHCHPFRKPTENYEQRRKYRQDLWNTWLNSVADDLDLLTDWWFFLRMYNLYGIALDGAMESKATLALLVFSGIGSVSYLLELYQVVFMSPVTFQWLPLFTILGEDIPQILLSVVLSGSFVDPTPIAAFNIATSVYSALIKISGELFLNHCYCCKFTPHEEANSYNNMESGRSGSSA